MPDFVPPFRPSLRRACGEPSIHRRPVRLCIRPRAFLCVVREFSVRGFGGVVVSRGEGGPFRWWAGVGRDVPAHWRWWAFGRSVPAIRWGVAVLRCIWALWLELECAFRVPGDAFTDGGGVEELAVV